MTLPFSQHATPSDNPSMDFSKSTTHQYKSYPTDPYSVNSPFRLSIIRKAQGVITSNKASPRSPNCLRGEQSTLKIIAPSSIEKSKNKLVTLNTFHQPATILGTMHTQYPTYINQQTHEIISPILVDKLQKSPICFHTFVPVKSADMTASPIHQHSLHTVSSLAVPPQYNWYPNN